MKKLKTLPASAPAPAWAERLPAWGGAAEGLGSRAEAAGADPSIRSCLARAPAERDLTQLLAAVAGESVAQAATGQGGAGRASFAEGHPRASQHGEMRVESA